MHVKLILLLCSLKPLSVFLQTRKNCPGPNRVWGPRCDKKCGRCNDTCNRKNGYCMQCIDNYELPKCIDCKTGYWKFVVRISGNYSTCTQCVCKQNERCNRDNGSCTACPKNFVIPGCKDCKAGFWGKSCSKTCGHCKNNQACNQITGKCAQCQKNYKMPSCVDCKAGFWGKSCLKTCGHCKNNQACDQATGRCVQCQKNYQMPLCVDCNDGFWGGSCLKTCHQCKNNRTCDQTTGQCAQCQKNYQMPSCVACNIGKYGNSCQTSCNCYMDYACDKKTGSCRHYGCNLFWSGKNRCDTKHECPRGKFGRQCVSCGKCKMSCKHNHEMCFPDCNRTSGECEPNQCTTYFTGKRCDSCVKLRYGLHCRYKCGQCFEDLCNEINGLCLEGCNRGYAGNKCDTPCKAGFYGYDCQQKCGECADKVPCSPITGECPGQKCAHGIGGDKCDQVEADVLVCPTGSFGKNCKQKCGKCAKNAACSPVDGTCANGCLDRYEQPFCLTCSRGYFGKSCGETCGHCKHKEVCDGFSGACPQGCADGFTGHYCKKRIGPSEWIGDDFSNYFDIDNF